MDFTLTTYRNLLNILRSQGFSFLTFSGFVSVPLDRAIVLRHDVDKLPGNSLRFAGIQSELGIKGTYYFRAVPESWDERIIEEIAVLGHEIGYHYEDLGTAAQTTFAKASMVKGRKGTKVEGLRDEETKGLRNKINGLHDRTTARLQDNWRLEKELADIAIESFGKNLQRLREIAPVKTICMHGSPWTRWDSRLLWKYYDYHDFGIVGEPYFDVDFDEVLYLTDTGRRWDGEAVSVRDKAQGAGRRAQGANPFEDWKVKPFKYRDETGGGRDLETKRLSDEETKKSPSVSQSLSPSVTFSLPPPLKLDLRFASTSALRPPPRFNSTSDIIKAAENNQLPDKIMMTFHPQRWTDKPGPWLRELVWQNVKNMVKYFLVKLKAYGNRL